WRWSSSLELFLHRLLPGGILLGAPLTSGAESIHEFLLKLARASPAVPFLAIEEGGGAMDPLRAFLPPLPSPRAAAGRGLADVTRLGELVGAALQLLGFNTDLAPLLDLAASERRGCEPVENPCRGTPWRAPTGETAETRAFSPDPPQVAKCGAAFLRGLERHNLLACGRHFPGLGTAQFSSPTEPPVVSKSMAELWREDLVPYRALLLRLPLVLVSTAAYKAYDFDLLQSAGLSPRVVEGLLRVKLGYNGVAIACGLESEAVRGTLQLGEAAVHALRAGCDALLLEKAEAAEVVHQALREAFESGRLANPRVEQALKRIQLAKKSLKPPSGRLSKGPIDRVIKEFKDFSSQFSAGELSNA
ncbi:MAG: glycoside hydrolase family 3 N-terminal domain-containing protein, partial [Terriglobia bacterium]